MGSVAGTLSFLFADLRDYSAFVEAHGDAAAAALIADYRRLVRAQVARAGGGEIKTEGDSFYVVFPAARQALQAGIGILQEAERQSRERPERPLHIGVGIHAGEPVPHEGQYVASAVNIAARLAQQAGAGELLVSEVVRGLLRTSGVPAMREREGIVLKGIQEALRVYAVAVGQARDPLLTRDPSLPSIAPVVAISAARAVSDQPALWRWIDLSLAPPGKLLRYVRGRDAFARGERAVLEGDLDTAINLLKEGVDTFSEGLLVLPVLMLRLRRAELLPQRGGLGDREGAQAELDAVVAYWRKAKATWYLGQLKEWAAERGLRFAGN